MPFSTLLLLSNCVWMSRTEQEWKQEEYIVYNSTISPSLKFKYTEKMTKKKLIYKSEYWNNIIHKPKWMQLSSMSNTLTSETF